MKYVTELKFKALSSLKDLKPAQAVGRGSEHRVRGLRERGEQLTQVQGWGEGRGLQKEISARTESRAGAHGTTGEEQHVSGPGGGHAPVQVGN